MSDDNEYPPLWQSPFVRLTLDEIRARCVDQFKLSQTRKVLFEALEAVCQKLLAAGVSGQIWLDGSFVTEKINPSDVDFVLLLSAEDYDAATPAQRAIVDSLVDRGDGWNPPSGCDTSFALIFPPARSNSPDVLTYWKKRFGYSKQSQTPKGIVVIALGLKELR